jgi:hypothetical protein
MINQLISVGGAPPIQAALIEHKNARSCLDFGQYVRSVYEYGRMVHDYELARDLFAPDDTTGKLLMQQVSYLNVDVPANRV